MRPPWARLIELAASGQLGRVVAVNATSFHWDTYASEGGSWWARKELSGGLLTKSCPHVIDAFNAICTPKREPADSVSAMYGPQQDASLDYPGDFMRWVLHGQEPCLTWREGLRTVEIIEAAGRSADSKGVPVRLPLHPESERS